MTCLLTSSRNLADCSLFTIATKPSNSPLIPTGSRYVSIKPIYVSTVGPLFLIQCLIQ